SLSFILPHPPTSTLFPYTTLFRSLPNLSLFVTLSKNNVVGQNTYHTLLYGVLLASDFSQRLADMLALPTISQSPFSISNEYTKKECQCSCFLSQGVGPLMKTISPNDRSNSLNNNCN